jgi:hypothetical protein
MTPTGRSRPHPSGLAAACATGPQVHLPSARRGRTRLRLWGTVVAVWGGLAGCTPAPGVPLTRGVSLDEHEAFFPIGDGAVHATGKDSVLGPISCDSCHAGTASFAQATCLNCHSQDTSPPVVRAHAGVAGFAAEDSRCLSCHPTGARGGSYGEAEHSRDQFPIGVESAHGNAAYQARVPAGATSCEACHASVDDRTVLLCAQCHAADDRPPEVIHQSFASSYEAEECIACHAETPAYTLLQHTEHVALPHSGVGACRTCHTAQRPEPKPWAIDFKAPMPFAGESCARCHSPEGTPTVLDRHDVDNFPIGPTTPHGDAAFLARVPAGKDRCTACHDSTLDPSVLACAGCHASDPVAPAESHRSFAVSFLNESCQACHASTPAYTLVEHFAVMPLPHSGISTCRSCHVANRAAPRDEAIDFEAPMPLESPSCVTCHAGGQIPDVDAHSVTNFPIGPNDAHGDDAFIARIPADQNRCTACHASVDDTNVLRCAQCHAADVPSSEVTHAAFSASFAAADCQACHASLPPLTVAAHAAALPLPHRNILECSSCHSTRKPSPREWEFDFRAPMPYESPSCVTCHGGGGVGVDPDVHSVADFPIRSTDLHGNAAYLARLGPNETLCSSCHVDTRLPRQLKCAQCHSSDEPPTATSHAAFPVSFATETCEACHADAPAFTLSEHAERLPVPHEGDVECRTCHTDNDVNLRPWTIDFAKPVSFEPPRCASCHPGGLVFTTAEHAATIFPIAAADVHGDADYLARMGTDENRCTSCHTDVATPETLRCQTCHDADAVPPAQTHAAFAQSFSAATCESCHATTPAVRIGAQNPAQNDHPSLGGETAGRPWSHFGIQTCASCHGTPLPAPREWATDFKAALPLTSVACRGCHPSSPCNAQNRSLCDGT